MATIPQTVRRAGQHTQAETSWANRAKEGAVKHPEAEAGREALRAHLEAARAAAKAAR